MREFTLLKLKYWVSKHAEKKLAFITLLVLFSTVILKSQSGRELFLEKRDVTCFDNGEISVKIIPQSDEELSDIFYSLFLLPNSDTPLSVNEEGLFSGLIPGSYLVMVNALSNGEEIVTEDIVNLSLNRTEVRFQLDAAPICGENNGRISVNVTEGVAKFFSIDGPIQVGPQASPIFENLPAGFYTISVEDECGDVTSLNYQLDSEPLQLSPQPVFKAFLPKCNEITVGHVLESEVNPALFPLNLSASVYAPDGSNEGDYTYVIEQTDLENNTIYFDIPFYTGEAFAYDLSVIDQCGRKVEINRVSIHRSPQISSDIRWGAGLCGERQLSIKPSNIVAPFEVFFDTYPETFNPSSFNQLHPGPFSQDNVFYGSVQNPIPEGFYSLRIIDSCGQESTISVNHTIAVGAPTATVLATCDENSASVEFMNFDYFLEKVIVLNGPSEFSSTYPLDLSDNISKADRRRFYLSQIPNGSYELQFQTSCGTEYTRNYEISGGRIENNNITVKENCGSFEIFLDHRINLHSSQQAQFGLQKLNPETGQWGHPATGAPYQSGDPLNSTNAVLLQNAASTINLNFSGDLRVVKALRVYRDGSDIQQGQSQFTHCISTLREFSFVGRAVVNDINSFACGDDRYDVYLNAAPYEPITYSIVSVDGIPVNISNGTNPLFTNLAEGRYQFRITDRCGNSTTFTLPLYGDNVPVITPTNLCENEEGSLSVPLLQGVSYEWYHSDNPETILSNSHILTFSPFNIATHSGTYAVRLSHENTESCINRELTFDIDPDQVEGNAGTGLEATVCAGDIINLFDYLEGPFGNYGRWKSVDNRAEIIGSTFDTEGYEPGLYQFEYTIVGLCAGKETSTVSLTLAEAVDPPTGSQIQEFCVADAPTIAALTAEGSNIVWYSTPQGLGGLDFTTPLIDGQTYYAEQVIDGCPSVERFPVVANIYPEISNVSISGGQEVFQMEQPTILTGDMPEGGKAPYQYQWQISTDGENWSNLEDGKEKDYLPDPLMETSHFRRITSDGLCGEAVSNSVSIEVKIAPIVANDDAYGPLKGFESHVLPVLTNDLFMGDPAEGSNLSAEIIRITNLEGVAAQLPASFNESGGLVLAEGSQPGTYLIEYEICQSLIPGNCARAVAEVWVGQIAFDMEKVVDSTRAIAGEILSYTFVMTNNSPFALNDIRVTDLLPEGLVFLSANASPQDPGLVWLIDNMGEGEEFLLTFDVMAAEDGRYTNTIEVTVADFRQSVQSQEVIVRPRESDVSISHEIMEGSVADGEELIYWITVTNFGIDDAFGVTITDQITERLRFLSWSVGANNTGIEPEFMLSGRTPTWQMQAIPTNTSITLEVRTMPVRGGIVEHEAWVTADGNDPNMENNATTIKKEIQPLFIPNVFKPDNDGKNETFMIRASHKFEKTQLLIFNRWGDTVFQSSDYQNDWNAEGLNAGTYYYQVKGQLATGEEIQYKGWVQVIK